MKPFIRKIIRWFRNQSYLNIFCIGVTLCSIILASLISELIFLLALIWLITGGGIFSCLVFLIMYFVRQIDMKTLHWEQKEEEDVEAR